LNFFEQRIYDLFLLETNKKQRYAKKG
jgi:hypothetical protein